MPQTLRKSLFAALLLLPALMLVAPQRAPCCRAAAPANQSPETRSCCHADPLPDHPSSTPADDRRDPAPSGSGNCVLTCCAKAPLAPAPAVVWNDDAQWISACPPVQRLPGDPRDKGLFHPPRA